MRKILLFLNLIILLFSLNYAESQQRKVVYFEKLPDEYSPSYVPENIIPPNAKKDRYKVPDNQGGSSGGLLKYEWEESDPNGNKCFVKLRYTRHSYSSTGHLSNVPYEDVRPISPEEKAYIYSLIWTDQCLTLEPQKAVAVEIQGIPQHHLPYNYPNDITGAKKIISDLRKSNSIPLGYVIFQCNNNSYNFSASYGNISLDVDISCSRLDYKRLPIPDFMKERVKQIGLAAYSRLTGNPAMVEKPIEQPKETQREQPKQEIISVKATIMPSAMGNDMVKTAYLPATKDLPARIVVETKPKTKVRFQILNNDKTAYLRATGQKSDMVEIVSDDKGQAKALFFYNGGKLTSPKQYEIRVIAGDKSDTVTVYVGLGLAFKTVKAVQGAYGDRHPFVLTLVSKHFPNLNLGLYFSVASREVWHGFTLGVKLEPYWLNKPKDLPNDKIFYGITKISPTMVNVYGENNVLTAVNYLDRETVYELSKYTYPAIKMMSDGIHNYKVKGELVLIDQNGKNYGRINEDLIQSDALIVLSKEKPEHFLTSLVCSFEAQSWDQTLMTEILTSLPIYGNFMDNFFQVTNLMCMFGKGEYGNLFLEMSKYLGGKWVDYLEDEKVFNKLTPKQQKAVKWAKDVLDQIEELEDSIEFIQAIDNILKNPHPDFKEKIK